VKHFNCHTTYIYILFLVTRNSIRSSITRYKIYVVFICSIVSRNFYGFLRKTWAYEHRLISKQNSFLKKQIIWKRTIYTWESGPGGNDVPLHPILYSPPPPPHTHTHNAPQTHTPLCICRILRIQEDVSAYFCGIPFPFDEPIFISFSSWF